ncbi:MAG: glycosyltransferase [Limimaricola soesokkakensis]|uniref:glycosyltransferase n=1 Tax=Limimaricola soesokkakensis TaxID=1343159 RepID=UPI00405873C9
MSSYDPNEQATFRQQIVEARIALDPTFGLYHEELANILWRRGDAAGARAQLDLARSKGSDPDWIDQLAARMDVAGRPDRFVGRYDFYPDLTGRRQGEGGLRLAGHFAAPRPEAPLVTIVTAVYDNPETFGRCIASVKAQDYDNIEYIVVDGGSPQTTLDVIRAHESQIDYWVSEPDLGIYTAMNKGIMLARGDYVCLLNSDDVYEPDFVTKAVACARTTAADIVYTDYHHGATLLQAKPVGPGLLLGHQNICHNTFLTSRRAYDRIGPYDESFRIVSDAVWMRRAWQAGLSFVHLPKALFTLTEGGLSSGNSATRRELFIREVVASYQRDFPQLSKDEARTIYLMRFDRKLLSPVLDIARRHSAKPSLFRDALREYIIYCLADRPNFAMLPSESKTNFVTAAKLCALLDIDLKVIRIETSQGAFRDILIDIEQILARRKARAKRTLLHFVSVFSAPSETFIYDLLTRLEELEDYDNFVLYEHPKLEADRPYDKKLQVAWRGYEPAVGEQIYLHILKMLKPDVIIAHFAINEHRLHERIVTLDLDIPTITMCHGIDVFSLKRPGEYKDHVLENFSERSNTIFTVVSDYLRGELIEAGVDPARIRLLPNTVSKAFFNSRKTKDFYDGSRQLRLLAIGRLIPLKGHRYLLDALARFKAEATPNVHLTIVYGNGDEELEALERQIEHLGLQEAVLLEPFVDFSKNPEYISSFDLFVHPATYSSDDLHRSETFGVSLLEAITAGLPVITTDAGGLPEVLGEPNQFAKIIPHGNSDALAEALIETWRNGEAFADNFDYAYDRLSTFSPENQLAGFLPLVEEVTAKPLRVAMFSTSTIQGAGYAAYRLHRGLQHSPGIRSDLFTTVRNHENAPGVSVIRHPSGNNAHWNALQIPPKQGKTIFTLNQPHIPSARLLEMVANSDVISLHWYARFLSAENIATLTHSDKPVVLTLRDMLPLTGGCHFFHGCDGWMADCAHCPQIPSRDTEFPAALLAEKRAHWNTDNLTLVALSTHSRRILERAPVFSDCRIEVIPNSIETDVFRPFDRDARRRDLGLPANRPIIGYVPSFSSEVKGYRELLTALDILRERDPDLDPFIMLVGNRTPATDAISFDKKALGYISSNRRLAEAYSAADVVVVPSLEETFSNTTAEAIACGVPVVGFRTGAIPDLAIDGRTGYTAETGDAWGLAEGLIKALRGPNLRRACRVHAEETLSFPLQAQRYQALFEELVTRSGPQARRSSPGKIYESFEIPAAKLIQIAAETVRRKST